MRDAHALWLPQENGSGLSPPAAARGAASEDMDGVPVFQLTCGEPGCCISLRLRPEQLGLEPVTLESVNMHEVRAMPSGKRAGFHLFTWATCIGPGIMRHAAQIERQAVIG